MIHTSLRRLVAMTLAGAVLAPAAHADAPIVPGKYGCASSSGMASSGTYQVQPRGSVALSAGGKYIYSGYEKPSAGDFKPDAQGVLHFSGGVFHGGTATPIDRPNKFFMVYPSIPGNRWTCSLVVAR
jgi:hypothetical protein